MIIRHNMLAMNAERQFKMNCNTVFGAQEKLASGYKINRSADDAAGLAISEKMRRQIRGLNMTLQNMQEGVSLCQAADGALTEVHAILQRMNELAVKAANGTNSVSDRAAVQQEIDQLTTEIDRVAYNTEIFGIYPLLGDAKITKTSYTMPENTIHTIKNAEIYDGRGSIRFMADGMTQPFAGTWTDADAKPIISVKDTNGHITGKVNLTNHSAATYKSYPGQNKFVTNYDDGTISFQMELTWKKVNCSTDNESREYFEFSYNFVNTSASALTFDFWLKMDMLVGVTSNAIPDINGTQTPNTFKWTGADIPEEMTVDNFVNLSGNGGTTVNVSAQYIWDGIRNSPDVVMSGDRFAIDFDDAMDSAQVGDLGHQGNDYFYGVGWSQKSVGANHSFVMQSRIGLYAEKTANTVSRDFVGNPPVWIQMGVESGIGMFLDICNATTDNLGIYDVNVMTEKGAGDAIEKIEEAIQKVSMFRSSFGAQQNRLEHAIEINSNIVENTQAAESCLRDTDITEMIVVDAIAKIAMEMSQSMLSQANHNPEMAMYLLG